MKKTVIYISAIAVLFSCTKENLGNNESFSEVKAEIVQNGTDVKVLIGDKDGDYYPLTWSAGDGIYAMTSTPTTIDKYFTSTVNPASVGTQIGYFKYPEGEDVTTMIAVHGGNIKKSASDKYTHWTSKTDFKLTCDVPANQDAFTVPMYAIYDNVNGSLKFNPAVAIIKFVNIPIGFTKVTCGAMSCRFSIDNKGLISFESYTGTPTKNNLDENPYMAVLPGERDQFTVTITNPKNSKAKNYKVAKRTLDAGKVYTLNCTKFTDVKD